MTKLRFEPGLDLQLQAVDAVCDLFHRHEVCRAEFMVKLAFIHVVAMSMWRTPPPIVFHASRRLPRPPRTA